MKHKPDTLKILTVQNALREFKSTRSWDDMAIAFENVCHTNTLRNFLEGKYTPINATLNAIAKRIKIK